MVVVIENNVPGVIGIINGHRSYPQPPPANIEDLDTYGGNAFDNFENTIYGGDAFDNFENTIFGGNA